MLIKKTNKSKGKLNKKRRKSKLNCGLTLNGELLATAASFDWI